MLSLRTVAFSAFTIFVYVELIIVLAVLMVKVEVVAGVTAVVFFYEFACACV